VAAAEPSKVNGLRARSGPESLRSRLSRRAGGRRKITGGEIEPTITSNPANLPNIIMTWQQDFGFGARTDFIGSLLDGGKTWAHSTIPPDGLPGSNGGLRVRPVDLGWR